MRHLHDRAATCALLCCAAVTIAACSSNSDTSRDSGAGNQTVVCPLGYPSEVGAGITQQQADLFLGWSESDTQYCAGQLGWAFRVGRRDDESFALTMDYSTQRVTVEVDDGIVTVIVVG
jgi:hypothetical protein